MMIEQKRGGLFSLYQESTGVEGIPPDGAEAAEVPVESQVLSCGATFTLGKEMGYLLGDALPNEAGRDLLAHVLADPASPKYGSEDDDHADFDDFMSWLWLCCRKNFNQKEAGFGKRVKQWLDDLPQFGGGPPPMPIEAPDPAPKAKKKK